MHKNGFTLIELLAVIVVIALIMVIAVPSVLNARNNALTGLSKEQENNIKQAGQMLGIDLDDYMTDIYNCKSDSWIDELVDEEGIKRCKKVDSKWIEVTLSVEDLVEHKYFDDTKGQCSGELTVTKSSSGYNVTLNTVSCG